MSTFMARAYANIEKRTKFGTTHYVGSSLAGFIVNQHNDQLPGSNLTQA